MKSVRINKPELLQRVRENRTNHYNTFEKSIRGYRDQVIQCLEKNLEDARKGREIRTFISLEQPINQTKEYDKAIKMLEVSVDDIIELTGAEFSNLFLDEWSWSANV